MGNQKIMVIIPMVKMTQKILRKAIIQITKRGIFKKQVAMHEMLLNIDIFSKVVVYETFKLLSKSLNI